MPPVDKEAATNEREALGCAGFAIAGVVTLLLLAGYAAYRIITHLLK